MKVTRLPKDTGPAAWNAILGPAPAPNPLEGSMTADWLVIGAGFAGLAAARRLAQNNPGDAIVLLDAVRIGEGPVGRNSGFMIDLPHVLTSDNYAGADAADADDTLANRAAIDFAAAAAEEYEMPAQAIVRAGKVNGAATARGVQHNRDYAAHLTRLGEAHEMLDAAQMAELTGSRYYESGLFTPGTAMLQPAAYARGMVRGLASNRLRVHDMSPVTSLERKGQAWHATTPAGAVSAPRVILAVNGHAESFGAFRGRLMHVMLYASMTRALSDVEVARLGGAPVWGITPSDPMGTTVRRISGTGGHRIIIRNRCTYAPSLALRGEGIGTVARDHDTAFRRRFPQLADVEMEYAWAGRLCLSRNDVPAFGEIEPGLFAACCQNGLGSAKGTVNGIAAADLASGRSSVFERLQSSKASPARVMPAFLMRVGAPAVIRWRERAAGREL
ncbi:MAG: FAD-binding oxidoreductase [Pseudomonadota bacterium]